MLSRNDLIEVSAPRRRVLRILWIDPGRTVAYVFDVNAAAGEAELVRLQALQADVEEGRARRLDADPFLVIVNQELLPPRHIAVRERAWAVVQALAGMEPAIYQPRKRGQLIAEYTARHGISHPTVYRYLRRYWQRGQTPNALLPDYANSGAPGRTRSCSEGVKRGRPRKDAASPGVNVDQAMRRIFRVASASHAATEPRFSRRAAYEAMIRDFFGLRSVDAATRRVQRDPPGGDVPSFGQFSYWLDQDGFPAQPAFPLPLSAQARVAAPGAPGEIFHLEVACADVQLVSHADRSLLAGRPNLYVVSDAFSGLVAGVYASLEAPSCQHALMAIANCAADKAGFCGRYGRSIDACEWPARHLPAVLQAAPELLAKKGEESLLNNFGVRCVPARPAPGAWRQAVEKRFGLRDAAEGPPDTPTLGPLDAAIDIGQFTRIVIDSVIEHNLGQRDGPAPVQLWDWGLRQRGSQLRQYPEEVVRCCLLPVAEAAVTPEGICLHGAYYSCALAVEQRWFERARRRGRWHVRVAYDVDDPDTIYLLDAASPLQFQPCRISRRSPPAQA
ncbi:Mu transposase C-terminal domain-containing protein [Massilia endophytica]|uniref:Mu transposase C-terminal domain-containing protein n=1 Tax=Massilia endophytica TaxID=2899220 RepID=UPI001E3D22C8|nr:Mu transposase C-terminal domain-containing protein [Massilia endophytica]UGQ46895.1 Mu transposase C-terminal domain-containing protein [Massilia endophytica]